MALKLKFTDEHGVLHIDVSPSRSADSPSGGPGDAQRGGPAGDPPDITGPTFDTINHRFAQYDLFGGKYEVQVSAGECGEGGEGASEGGERSLFRSRYSSVQEELANTPYAFERTVPRAPPDPTRPRRDRPDARLRSPSQDIEDDRFFTGGCGLFGPSLDSRTSDEESETPAFTVTQLIHAQDRYYDLSARQTGSRDSGSAGRCRSAGLCSSVGPCSSAGLSDNKPADVAGAFRVLPGEPRSAHAHQHEAVSSGKKKKESSFAIISELPVTSRPTSPHSLPADIRAGRVSPFRGRGFREETSRHNTPKTSAANSRASSPLRRRTNSLPRIDNMAQTATLPPPIIHMPQPSRPHSPRNFLKENIEEVREMSEFNREKHEAEAEKKRIQEEEAILKEMGLIDKKSDGVKSRACSRANSRSNSPNRIKLRSRSNSPSAVLCVENITADSKDFINPDDGMPKPAIRKSRGRVLSKSQPQSSDTSPKHSKIPKRQSSVSPSGIESRRNILNSKPLQNGTLHRSQRFMSNSTSSIHETIRIGSQVHDKRPISKSTQLLDIIPPHIKGKPPISPGRGGPPPTNKAINPKRLSPIVGTPNKSPIEDQKPSSIKTTPTKTTSGVKKPATKPVTNTTATSRLAKNPRVASREPSPDKRRITNAITKTTTSAKVNGSTTRPVSRVASTKTTQRPPINNINKSEPKKAISRTNSIKSLTRTPSTKNLNEKPPILKKKDSKTDLTINQKNKSSTKINEVGSAKDSKTEPAKETTNDLKSATGKRVIDTKKESSPEKNAGKHDAEIKSKPDSADVATQKQISKQDSETQYDKITNEKGELVIMTKKNIVSMTTAAITSQPLEVVTTVTNQLPAALEKAREKGLFERLNSKDSLVPKDEEKNDGTKTDLKEAHDEKNDDKKVLKPKSEKAAVFLEDNVKLKPLQPPYNNPAVERVKQKIDSILKEPEVSPENILATSVKSKEKEIKSSFKSVVSKTKSEAKEAKDVAAAKLTEIKNQAMKLNDKTTSEIRNEATKIIESIMTPVEEPKTADEKPKQEVKKTIEPIVTVVNEKNKHGPSTSDVTVKVNETLVKGEAEVEVQSSNLSTPGMDKAAAHKMAAHKMAVISKMADSSSSDKSEKSVSNGGFPQSTSTTPKPPARLHRQKEQNEDSPPPAGTITEPEPEKQPNICTRLMNKCKTKCCPCCIKTHDEEEDKTPQQEQVEQEKKKGMLDKLNCCKKRDIEEEDKVRDLERAAGKAATIEFENETKPKRTFRDVICCCRNRRRVSDSSDVEARDVTSDVSGAVAEAGCCGTKKRVEQRRDSILSDRPPNNWCSRLRRWAAGAGRRGGRGAGAAGGSRRTSVFSKNKSTSPTLPPEDTRRKLDASLVEHTSLLRGALPALPVALAALCLAANTLVPGLGTILSGMFCLCFGIPRFGVHDGAKHRIGSFVINLVVGAGQLFTVLFCLVGWGWSIWWGVILLKTARKYRKLKAEAAAEEAESVPPVTSNNHTQA